MDARELINALRGAGVSVGLNGDRIRYSAEREPGDETMSLIVELSKCKQEAVALLAEEATRPGITVADVLRVFPGARVLTPEEAVALMAVEGLPQ